MEPIVRVRFAPSPTGVPHIGNIRTALFNWLFARHTGGVFVLRIEDTDVARRVAGAVEAILDGLRWLGLNWDEGPEVGGPYGPYIQSERLPLYQAEAERLVEAGHAYRCYCSAERLAEMRAEQERRKEPPRYDRRCRDLTLEERAAFETQGIAPVIRFKVPLTGQTTFEDLIRGPVTFDNSTLDDFVMLKSDGYPTYHLAVVVDDHFMRITHVMRGEEWISSTPKHVLLHEALGFSLPQFAHLPMILGKDRSKLSKRHGATSLGDYRQAGYLPEALMNFLALLGWSLDEKTEILSRDELVRHFSIERIGKTPAIFNIEKLDWMNGVYIRGLSVDDLAARVTPFLEAGLPPEVSRPLPEDYIRQIVPLVQERLKKLSEIVELTDFFFASDLVYDPLLLVGKKMTKEQSLVALQTSYDRLSMLAKFDKGTLESMLRPLAEELALGTGQLFGTLRVAVTGRTVAPPLFETMAVLGKERTLKRIKTAIRRLQGAD